MKKFLLALITTALIVSGCTAPAEDPVPADEAPLNSFKYDEEKYVHHGTLTIEGYATLEEQQESFCEEDCSTYTYIFFNILNTDNEAIDNYVKEGKGNSFIGDNSIGLGCVEDNSIWHISSSDISPNKEYETSQEVSYKILNSSIENPITIEVTRPLFTGGAGAPDCYSHFTQFNIVD
ncbi:hypothetical protein HN709_03345 [Candidatus Peregrinibacteria bacterium]|jgi:hypothetical protein|nr:hypothetical protein [Candidatus Peregrinibacteria bacterium]MBT7736700.1 hypothetical protein [Candidatus Peregrinibacteria bacterium]